MQPTLGLNDLFKYVSAAHHDALLLPGIKVEDDCLSFDNFKL